MPRPPLPPFNEQTAIEKVRLAEDGWNSRDAAKVALAYTLGSVAVSSRTALLREIAPG